MAGGPVQACALAGRQGDRAGENADHAASDMKREDRVGRGADEERTSGRHMEDHRPQAPVRRGRHMAI